MTAEAQREAVPVPTTATILVANDQEWTGRSLESVLVSEGHRVVRAYTGIQAIGKALAVDPDVIFLDVQLPDISGLEVCRRLRGEMVLRAAVPIFLTTAGQAGRAERLDALRAGAWEFYAQPFDSELIIAKLRSFLAAKDVADSLRRAAVVDPLTGLYTERGLSIRAQEFGSEAARFHRPAAVVALTADAGGSRSGRGLDRLISLVKAGARSSDIVGRHGGSEVLVVAEAGTAGARHLVDRIVSRFRDAGTAGDRDGLRVGFCGVDRLGDPGRIDAMIGMAREALRHATAEAPVRMASVA